MLILNVTVVETTVFDLHLNAIKLQKLLGESSMYLKLGSDRGQI